MKKIRNNNPNSYHDHSKLLLSAERKIKSQKYKKASQRKKQEDQGTENNKAEVSWNLKILCTVKKARRNEGRGEKQHVIMTSASLCYAFLPCGQTNEKNENKKKDGEILSGIKVK